eukprot:1142174-Pelagomonas_calceolata.AAC.6
MCVTWTWLCVDGVLLSCSRGEGMSGAWEGCSCSVPSLANAFKCSHMQIGRPAWGRDGACQCSELCPAVHFLPNLQGSFVLLCLSIFKRNLPRCTPLVRCSQSMRACIPRLSLLTQRSPALSAPFLDDRILFTQKHLIPPAGACHGVLPTSTQPCSRQLALHTCQLTSLLSFSPHPHHPPTRDRSHPEALGPTAGSCHDGAVRATLGVAPTAVSAAILGQIGSLTRGAILVRPCGDLACEF